MNIMFMTRGFSPVLQFLVNNIREGNKLCLVDFSEDGILQPFAGDNISYEKYTTWDSLSLLAYTDLLISYKLNYIIPMWLIDKFRYGGINIHPSLLPKHPGLNPWFSTYFEYDLTSGVTIHKLAAQPDTGNIIIQQAFDINPGDPLDVTIKSADAIAASLLKRTLSQRLYAQTGTPQSIPEEHGKRTNVEDCKLFDVEKLWHLFRGFPQLISQIFPSLPHSCFNVGEYKRTTSASGIATIVGISDNQYEIRCRDGVIALVDTSIA